jgi:outer membrane cobalamin receptor
MILVTPLRAKGLSGQIVDRQGQAIAGGAVTDRKTVTYSDAGGGFLISTKADSLYISRLGFHKLAVHTRNVKSPIILYPDEIVLPRIWVRAVEYQGSSPSLNAMVIHPDTNQRVEGTTELLLESSAFGSTDIRLAGERQTVSLLGGFSRHALVMLDGVVMNHAGEDFDFSKIPLGQIDHIEIIKGNSSVYGGSAAIGGIIHIHTRAAAMRSIWDATLSSSTGSFGLFKQHYSASLSHKTLAFEAEYTHQATRNDFKYNTPDFWNIEPELKRTHNRKTADSFYARASYAGPFAQIEYSINAGSFVRQLPGPINFLALYDDSRLSGYYLQHGLRGIYSHRLLANELLLWSNSDHSTYKNLNPTNSFGRNHYLQEQHNQGLKTSHNLNWDATRLGFSAEQSRVDYSFRNRLSDTSISGKRDNTALSIRAQQNLYPWIFSYRTVAAVRGDYSAHELHPTWRLEQELSLPLEGDLALGGYIGTAFAQPSLFDMYWIGDSETHGNPDLKSESSLGLSAYASYQSSGLTMRTAYYRNRVKDLIQWRQYYLNGASWKPFNVGKAEIQNLELEAQTRLFRFLNLSGGITFTKAIDLSENPDGSPTPTYRKKLVYTPDLKATLSLSLNDAQRGVSIRYSYTGEQYSTTDNLIQPLKAFDNLDTAAFYRIGLAPFELQLDLKLNNLLNRRYDIYAYIPQPGINWTAGLSLAAKSKSARKEPIPTNTTKQTRYYP